MFALYIPAIFLWSFHLSIAKIENQLAFQFQIKRVIFFHPNTYKLSRR